MPTSIDPHEPGWLSLWLARAFVDGDFDAFDAHHALDRWIEAPTDDPGVACRALLAWLAALRLPPPPETTANPRSRRREALVFARALAWLCDRDADADALGAALDRHDRQVPDGATTRRALDAALDDLGRALCARIADGVDGWIAAATLAVVAGLDGRAMVGLHSLARGGAPSSEALDTIRGAAAYDRLAVLEAIVGLVRADHAVDGRERRLLEAAMRAAAVDPGEARLLRRYVHSGGEDLDGIANALPSARGRVRLLLLLEVAALADGVADEREVAWIDQVAASLGASAAERVEAHERLLAHSAATTAMGEALGRTPLADAASRRAERQVRALVRSHLRAIVREVQQTGDLMTLLAAATQRPLETEEHERLRAQLLDLCRAVPALAIFAAPGGTLLLPILARVLPFSLTPSSFRDKGL